MLKDTNHVYCSILEHGSASILLTKLSLKVSLENNSYTKTKVRENTTAESKQTTKEL